MTEKSRQKINRSSRPEVFCKKSFFLNKVAGLRPAILLKMRICEFCEISKNTFSNRTPPVAVSELNISRTKKAFKDKAKSIF